MRRTGPRSFRRVRRCLRAAWAPRLLAVLAAWQAGILAAVATDSGRNSENAGAGPIPEWRVFGGPLIQTFPLTLEPGRGTEAVGPLYFGQETEAGHLWGVPPLVSSYTSRDGDKGELHVLPPIFSFRKYGDDWRWQLGQWLNRSHLESIEDKDLKRFNLFPFFFYQDAPDPKRDYWALFPLYGTLKNRFFRDETEFVLFPLWMKSRKGTMTTRNVVFPFVHFRDGPGLDGWQFWPLAGHERLAPVTRTNVADEVEVVAGHDKTFALWPVWFRNRTGIGTTNSARVDAALPFYYQERSPKRDHTSLLWPFVSWTEDHGEKFEQWNLPWPLVGFARGEGKTLDRVLPFFSVGHSKTLDAETYLWPLWKRRRIHTEGFERDRKQVAVFLFQDLTERNLASGKTARRTGAWPFFDWSRDPDGKERLQVFTVIEPFGRGTAMTRNWSPLWSVWRQERNPKTGARSQSLLWNLYRRHEGPDESVGSFLFGLVRYHQTSSGTRWRWFQPASRPESKRIETSRSEPLMESRSDVQKHR